MPISGFVIDIRMDYQGGKSKNSQIVLKEMKQKGDDASLYSALWDKKCGFLSMNSCQGLLM